MFLDIVRCYRILYMYQSHVLTLRTSQTYVNNTSLLLESPKALLSVHYQYSGRLSNAPIRQTDFIFYLST